MRHLFLCENKAQQKKYSYWTCNLNTNFNAKFDVFRFSHRDSVAGAMYLDSGLNLCLVL